VADVVLVEGGDCIRVASGVLAFDAVGHRMRSSEIGSSNRTLHKELIKISVLVV
jgi:hypothetical protein